MAEVLLVMTAFYSVVASLRGRVRAAQVIEAVSKSFCDVLCAGTAIEDLGLEKMTPDRAAARVAKEYADVLVKCAQRELAGSKPFDEDVLRGALDVAVEVTPALERTLPMSVVSSEVVRMSSVIRFVMLNSESGSMPASDARPRTALN